VDFTEYKMTQRFAASPSQIKPNEVEVGGNRLWQQQVSGIDNRDQINRLRAAVDRPD